MKRASSWRRSVQLLAFGVLVAQIAFSMAAPLLPVYLSDLGLRKNVALWSGLIFSINSITFGIMSPIWGSISDRYGKRPMILRAGMGMGITYALMSMARNHVQLFLLRGLNGILSGYIPAVITLVTTIVPEARLGWALGTVQSASAIGVIMGPLVGGLAAQILGIRASFVFSSILLITAALVPYFWVGEPPVQQKGRVSVSADVKLVLGIPAVRVFLAVFLFVQAAAMVVQPTIPLFVAALMKSRVGVPVTSGLVFSLVGISTALGCPLIAKTRDSQYGAVMLASLFLASGLNLIQGFSATVFALAVARFLFGFANAGITVSGNVLFASATPKDARGRAFGLLNSITSIGSVLGPILGGFLGETLGLRSSFWGSSVLFFVAGILAVTGTRVAKREARPTVAETELANSRE